ncbi:MAG: aminoacyl-tRNA hydrolase [Planctomycetes bacterium]|nr:aminoacyl-tRNA hydrolase [Planctomycetota bacterium]
MFEVTPHLQIPKSEFHWTFVRSGGPGGQNVNKVASRAVLRWDLAANTSLSEDIKTRLRMQQRRRMTSAGELILSSQRFRDQKRNIEDCLEKVRALVLQAATSPKVRKPTKRSRASHRARLEEKRRRTTVKKRRRPPVEE